MKISKEILLDVDVKPASPKFEIGRIFANGNVLDIEVFGNELDLQLSNGDEIALSVTCDYKVDINKIDLTDKEPISSYDSYYMLENNIEPFAGFINKITGKTGQLNTLSSDDKKFIENQLKQLTYSTFKLFYEIV